MVVRMCCRIIRAATAFLDLFIDPHPRKLRSRVPEQILFHTPAVVRVSATTIHRGLHAPP